MGREKTMPKTLRMSDVIPTQQSISYRFST
jgi:hypothetical protein